MSIQNKPDYKVFASDAKSGEVETFPDILRGWGVTIDRTGEIPPMEWFNAIGKRTDEWLLYLTQRGIPEWDSSLDYPKSAVVTHGDVIYISLKESKGEQPDRVQAAWSLMVKKATTEQEGIVQLTNTIDTSKDKAITPFAVNELQKLIFDAVPVGVVKAYVGETAPNDKWLLCRGQAFSAESYPDLAQLLPDLKIPDLRGVALRGLDAGKGFDPARTLLSYQQDAMQKIEGRHGAVVASGAFGAFHSLETFNNNGFAEINSRTHNIGFDSSRVTRTNPQNETVMKNVAVNFIIKAR